MKIIILIMIMTLSLIAADATKAAKSLGLYNNYTQALKSAKLKDEFMVFMVVWDPCNACDSLVNDTLSDKKIKEIFKKSTALILDYKAQMPKKFKIQMAPHIYYINPQNEEILLENVGRISVTEFLNDYKEAEASFLGK